MMLLSCDLVLIPFPFTNLTASKKRPVLVLKEPNEQGDFIAAQVTSQAGYADAMALFSRDLIVGSLPKMSYVRTSKLITLNQSLVVAYLGKLDPKVFMAIHQKVCYQLSCVSDKELNCA